MDAKTEEKAPPVGEERPDSAAPGPGGWKSRRQRLRWPLMIAGVLIAVGVAAWYYLTSGRYVSTDDSSLQAAQMTISSNVPGRVVELDVHDNQRVRRGQMLFRLDQRPFRIAVRAAEARLAVARMQITAAKATYRQRLADVAADRATLAYARQDFQRQQRLLRSGITSRAKYDQSQHALAEAHAKLASAQQQVGNVLALLGGNPALPVDQQPSVQQAQAALDRAELNLSYTVIRAPGDGITAKVEQLQVGDYINAAAPVFSLISTRDIWVEANFKETQITYMRPGDSAVVSIDAYPGRVLHAHVASLSPGTGAQFSLLPPENATGNWVKVVQRVPVRLQLNGDEAAAVPLHAGLSATVTVDTRHQRHLFGGGQTSTGTRVARR